MTSLTDDPAAVRGAAATLVKEGLDSGGPSAALERFWRLVAGATSWEGTNPGLRDRMLASADTFFGVEVGTFVLDNLAADGFRVAGASRARAKFAPLLVPNTAAGSSSSAASNAAASSACSSGEVVTHPAGRGLRPLPRRSYLGCVEVRRRAIFGTGGGPATQASPLRRLSPVVP